jgi:Kef-type K+ transport system membrane component KefB
MAGFEMDPAVLSGRPIRNALAGWVLTAMIAFGAAVLLARAGLASGWLLTGLALTTSSIGALLPVLRDSGLLSPPYGPMVLAAGALGEAAPVIVLSLVLAQGRAPLQAMIMLAFAAGATGAVILAARASGGYLATIVARTMGTSGQLRAALERRHDEAISARLDGLGSAFLVPIFFITAGVRLDVASLFSDPIALMMVPLYAALMLVARGLPALLLYRADLSLAQRIGLALHSGTQLSLVVAITSIAVHRGLMPGVQGAELVGGGILTTVLYPAIARRFLLREALPVCP